MKGSTARRLRADRSYKGIVAPPPRERNPRKRPWVSQRRSPAAAARAPGDGGGPSTQRLLIAVARSKAQCGNARSGHAAQDGLGWSFRGRSSRLARETGSCVHWQVDGLRERGTTLWTKGNRARFRT
jgi:hypothetical protein